VIPNGQRSTFPTATAPARRFLWLRVLLLALLALSIVALAASAGLARFGGAYQLSAVSLSDSLAADPEAKVITPAKAAKIEAKLASFQPRGVYLTVDTYRNRLRVFDSGKQLREAVCSTGTGIVLKDPRTGRQWVFDTPMGEYPIERKSRKPQWVKPDWAYIEDGYIPPAANSPDRYDDFSLGDFALYMPDGYIIHGTLFKTLLGQRATHGCVRLGDEDLEFVYKTVPVGSRAFLY